MSTFTLAAASAPKMRPATPGSSATPEIVTRASFEACVTAVTIGCSIVSSSETTSVPGPSSNELRQWMRTPWFRAYSTERSWRTPAPEADISSISSNESDRELARVRADPGVGGEDAGDVRVDLADRGAERGRERDRGGIGAAAAERRDVEAVAGDPLEPGDEDDAVGLERLADAVGANLEDPGLGVGRVGDDPRLRAGERDGGVAHVVNRHRAERAGDPLADREQHVHLALVGTLGDLVGHGDEVVGGLPPRREHGHDLVARFARGHDPLRGAAQVLGLGDGRAPELHDDGFRHRVVPHSAWFACHVG